MEQMTAVGLSDMPTPWLVSNRISINISRTRKTPRSIINSIKTPWTHQFDLKMCQNKPKFRKLTQWHKSIIPKFIFLLCRISQTVKHENYKANHKFCNLPTYLSKPMHTRAARKFTCAASNSCAISVFITTLFSGWKLMLLF